MHKKRSKSPFKKKKAHQKKIENGRLMGASKKRPSEKNGLAQKKKKGKAHFLKIDFWAPFFLISLKARAEHKLRYKHHDVKPRCNPERVDLSNIKQARNYFYR